MNSTRCFLVVVLGSILFAGCDPYGWDDLPHAEVRPESRDPSVTDAAWREEVGGAIDEWTIVLEPFGCEPPFVLSNDLVGDHRVRLVSNEAWTWTGADGVTFADAPTQPAGSIEVRSGPKDPRDATLWRRPLLLHELGHALGLGHADPANGNSIMTPTESSELLTNDDIAAAACVLGCGPCGTTTDPYTL